MLRELKISQTYNIVFVLINLRCYPASIFLICIHFMIAGCTTNYT